MPKDDLEQGNAQVEPAKNVSEKEQDGEVLSETEAEVSGEKHQEEVLTKESVAQVLAAKEKEWQSRKDKEVAVFSQRTRELEKQMKDAELAAKEGREVETWGDTTEVKDFHRARREFFEEQAKYQVAIADVIEKAKSNEATELAAKYSVDRDELMKAESSEQMKTRAIELAYEKVISEKAKPQGTPVETDSGVKTTSGINLADLSPDELIKRALSQPIKHK